MRPNPEDIEGLFSRDPAVTVGLILTILAYFVILFLSA